MACHPEVHDVGCSQFNDGEDEERTEQDAAGPDLTGVFVDACPDGLPPIFIPVLMLVQLAESEKVGLLELVACSRVNYEA